jgi:hypothetical protein
VEKLEDKCLRQTDTVKRGARLPQFEVLQRAMPDELETINKN